MSDYDQHVKLSVEVEQAIKDVERLTKGVKEFHELIDERKTIANLDARDVLNKLQTVQTAVDKVKSTISDLKDVQLSVGSVSLDKSLGRVDNTIKDIKNTLNDAGSGTNSTALDPRTFEKLTASLKQFGDELKAVLDQQLNSLSRKFSNTISANFKRAFDVLHEELERLSDDILLIQRQSVSVNTDTAKMNLATLREQLTQLKTDVMQMQSLQLESSGGNNGLLGQLKQIRQMLSKQFELQINTKQANAALDSLKKNLIGIEKLVKQIGESVINVNVTNYGFDNMIKNFLKQAKLLEGVAMRLKQQVGGKQGAFTVLRNYLVKDIKNMSTAGFGRGVSAVRREATTTANIFKNWGGLLLKVFYSARGIAAVFQEMQGFAYNIGQYVSRFVQNITQQLIPAVKTLLSQGFESASTFEDARIAYKLFFPNENPDDVIRAIKARAIENPVFDATDLSKYVAQLAPLSGGNSELAMDAIEGIAAMLKASGQEVSTYMQRLVTNTQQVVSTGKATARDWNEFLRATPVFEMVLEEVTPSLRKKLNDDNAEITKAETTQLLKALQLVRNESSISGVLGETRKTWSSQVQEMKEALQTGMGEIVEASGLYGMMKNLLQQLNDETSGLRQIMNDYLRPVIDDFVALAQQVKLSDVRGTINDVYHIFRSMVKDILEIFEVDTGNLNVSGIRTIITRVTQFIADFIKGWAEGIKKTIDFAKGLMQFFGRNPEDFAALLGLLASPYGNLINRGLNAIAGAGQLVANLSSGIKDLTRMFKTLTNVGKMTKILSNVLDGALSNISSGLANVINVATRFVAGIGIMFAGNTVNDMLYSANKNWGTLGDITQIASGAFGGAIAGSTFGPIGAAAGGILGTIGQGFAAMVKESERIAEATEETAANTRDARKKLIAKYSTDLAKGVVDIYNSKAAAQGLATIDTNTNLGYYAMRRIAKYLEDNYDKIDSEEWSTENLVDQLMQNYTWKSTAEKLDDYVDTEYFRGLGGDKWDYLSDLRGLKNVGNILRGERLLGDWYDYEGSSNEQIVKDFLNGVEWTTTQANEFVRYYQESLSEAEQLKKSVEDFSYSADEQIKGMTGLANALENADSPYVTAMDNLNTEAEKLGIVLSNIYNWLNKYTIPDDSGAIDYDENGNKRYTLIYPDSDSEGNPTGPAYGSDEWYKEAGKNFGKEAAKKLDEENRKKINELLGPSGFAHGGYVKPAYKASGGGISARGVDTVPAMLQPGEFVVRRSVVEKVGLPAMTALNLGDSKLAASLMGRPNITTNSGGNNYSRNSNDNRKSINQFIRIVNRNNSATLNSYHSLANRLALG